METYSANVTRTYDGYYVADVTWYGPIKSQNRSFTSAPRASEDEAIAVCVRKIVQARERAGRPPTTAERLDEMAAFTD